MHCGFPASSLFSSSLAFPLSEEGKAKGEKGNKIWLKEKVDGGTKISMTDKLKKKKIRGK